MQLYSLCKFWQLYPHFWITFNKKDTNYLLQNEKVYWAFHPTNRNFWNLIKNLYLAFKILLKEKPDVFISTGAGVAVPFSIVGKILGSDIIYIESLTRVNELSLSGKIIYFFADNFLVQWPQLEAKYKRAKYQGKLV